jgi:hypothetical protein
MAQPALHEVQGHPLCDTGDTTTMPQPLGARLGTRAKIHAVALDPHHPGAPEPVRGARSVAAGCTTSEEHGEDLLAADSTNQLAQRAVDEDEDDEPELGGPELRPDQLAH